MKLQIDCVRDVLLVLERVHRISVDDSFSVEQNTLTFRELCSELPDWDRADVFYTVSNLKQAGLLFADIEIVNDYVVLCLVSGLTYEGHKYLDSIRDEQRWAGIKKALPAIRNYSLDAIRAITEGATSAAITAYFRKYPE